MTTDIVHAAQPKIDAPPMGRAASEDEPSTTSPSGGADTKSHPVEAQCAPDGHLSIRGEATIHHAALLHAQLVQLDLAKFDRISLDLSGLSALDTAGAQILIALRRSSRSLSVHSCPDSARQFLELTGLTTLLTDEVP